MNKGVYTYCLLQYHHSQILGEMLNVGLIVCFPHVKKFKFIRPPNLDRLKFAYPNFPEKTVKSYLEYFEQRAEELNQTPAIFGGYDLTRSIKQLVNDKFLPADSSALQFANFRPSVLYTSDTEHLSSQLYNHYFSVYQVEVV